jgi:hypothetical protein
MIKGSMDLKSAIALGLYWVWTGTLRVVFLTTSTFLIHQSSVESPTLRELSDHYQGWLLLGHGVGSLALLWILSHSQPLFQFHLGTIWNRTRWRTQVLPGLIAGTLAVAVSAALWLSTPYFRILGSSFHAENWVGRLLYFPLAVIALASWFTLEEWFFREYLLRRPWKFADHFATFAGMSTPILFFHLGVAQSLMWGLLSVFLTFLARHRQDFGFGSGLLASFLVGIHLFLGFPIFGLESDSLFSVRYSPPLDRSSEWIRLLSGGSAGPLSSLLLAGVLGVLIGFLLLSSRRKVR